MNRGVRGHSVHSIATSSASGRSLRFPMLFADKQALETELKVSNTRRSLSPQGRLKSASVRSQVSLLAIRERELDLYTDNCRNIGAQSALLAGFAFTALTYQVVPSTELCTAEKALEGVNQQCMDPKLQTVRHSSSLLMYLSTL